MRPSERKIRKWRKKIPMIHRSFALKRERNMKEIKKEINSLRFTICPIYQRTIKKV